VRSANLSNSYHDAVGGEKKKRRGIWIYAMKREKQGLANTLMPRCAIAQIKVALEKKKKRKKKGGGGKEESHHHAHPCVSTKGKKRKRDAQRVISVVHQMVVPINCRNPKEKKKKENIPAVLINFRKGGGEMATSRLSHPQEEEKG